MEAYKEFDILDIASLKWDNLRELSLPMWNAQAAVMGDKLYVGGGETLDNYRDDARLYIYCLSGNLWNSMDVPVYRFALTTYHSQLVLVGGWKYVGEMPGDLTNKLWILSKYDQLQEILPPMLTERYSASALGHGDHLIVAGGGGDVPDLLSVVEIYYGKNRQWFSIEPLPTPCSNMKSTVYNKHWYLIGGCGQKQEVYYASLDSLTASYDNWLQDRAWKQLTDVPLECTSVGVFGNRLITIGGELEFPSSAVNAYSPRSQSWIHVGDMPAPLSDTVTVILPSGELMVIGELPQFVSNVLRMTVKGTETLQKQLSLQDETITYLKEKVLSLKKEKDATILTLKEQNKGLISELQELNSQLKELKEEAIPMTKAGTSAQLITATWNLRGVEVCGEMTVVVYSSHNQQITWPGYGLRLNIPEGSLPVGIEQCTINIKASLAGQYEFPENFHLVSAIFWLHCEDVHEFTKSITVEIQHCVKSEDITNFNLNFVRAVCCQKQLPYTFKQLLGGNFTSRSSYAVIELNSFSGVGITQDGSEDRQYYSKLFYLSNYKFGGHRIDFAVTWNTEAHINIVEKHYSKEGALPGPDQPIEFEGEAIRLDLPMEETTINDRWTIVPLIDPVVTKSEVDSYLPGTRLPHCELVAHPIEGQPVTRLLHKIILLGAKPPRNKFTLSYMPPIVPEGSAAEVETPKPLKSNPKKELDSKLTTPELKVLLRELRKVANEWEDIGIELDIEEGHLKQIKSDNTGDSKACLREMLRVWLSHVAPPRPSWSAIADALDTLGHQDIATHLRLK